MPQLAGVSHIDFTVTDGERSCSWWQEVMGFNFVTRFHGDTFEGWSLMDSTGLTVSVMTHSGRTSEKFDERTVGLDHFSLQVTDRAELQRWAEHFDAHGVENSGVIDAEWGQHLVFRDPDNIQLELFVPVDPETMAAMLADRNPES